MSEGREYSEWIDHDGRGFPHQIFQEMRAAGWPMVQINYVGEGRTQTPLEQSKPGTDSEHPGWIWRKRYHLFGELVASDTAYKRIIRYRFWRDKPSEKSAQVEALKDLVANPDQPILDPQDAS